MIGDSIHVIPVSGDCWFRPYEDYMVIGDSTHAIPLFQVIVGSELTRTTR